MGKRKALLSTKLQSFSDRDKVWEKHKVNAELVATHYADSQFPDYSRRIALCGESLDFELVDDQLKLKNTWFCRVRHCPICQWRRSLNCQSLPNNKRRRDAPLFIFVVIILPTQKTQQTQKLE